MLIQDAMHGNASELGIFDAAIGLGLLIGGILAGALPVNQVKTWFVVGLALQGIGLVTDSLSHELVVSYIGNFVIGVGVMITSVPMATLFQALTPSSLRGRVSSFSSMLFNISIPVTYGGIGLLGDFFGPRVCYSLGGMLLLICSLSALMIVVQNSSQIVERTTSGIEG
ncbi:MFS transporter [Alicyclobacillus macrosporangiidus]|uniref:MFS transporter n=1 Tax=Alicyclobacillus macrosporangiidus TaxID=392015 RepID=UPI00158751C2